MRNHIISKSNGPQGTVISFYVSPALNKVLIDWSVSQSVDWFIG